MHAYHFRTTLKNVSGELSVVLWLKYIWRDKKERLLFTQEEDFISHLFGKCFTILADCPLSYTLHENICFNLVRDVVTSVDADKLCERLGGELAHFTTVNQFYRIHHFVQNNSKR